MLNRVTCWHQEGLCFQSCYLLAPRGVLFSSVWPAGTKKGFVLNRVTCWHQEEFCIQSCDLLAPRRVLYSKCVTCWHQEEFCAQACDLLALAKWDWSLRELLVLGTFKSSTAEKIRKSGYKEFLVWNSFAVSLTECERACGQATWFIGIQGPKKKWVIRGFIWCEKVLQFHWQSAKEFFSQAVWIIVVQGPQC